MIRSFLPLILLPYGRRQPLLKPWRAHTSSWHCNTTPYFEHPKHGISREILRFYPSPLAILWKHTRKSNYRSQQDMDTPIWDHHYHIIWKSICVITPYCRYDTIYIYILSHIVQYNTILYIWYDTTLYNNTSGSKKSGKISLTSEYQVLMCKCINKLLSDEMPVNA